MASCNTSNFNDFLNATIDEVNQVISEAELDAAVWQSNVKKIKQYIRQEHDDIAWEDFWENLLITGFRNCNDLSDLDSKLKKENKRVVFLIDGLEEVFTKTLENQNEKNAIVSLVRDLVNSLKAKYSSVGCVVFLRQDMARNAIGVNYTQFESVYKNMELNWSKTEALRLALWLVYQATPDFYSENIAIEQASSELIENCLIKLWGRKLGKSTSNEANSSKWILAALSDFNGQLQARDIIRFLQYATADVGKNVYNDRIIMPNEIRKAVPLCSEEKIEEVKQEISALAPILQRLGEATEDKRILPFAGDDFGFTQQDISIMKQEGYLRIDNDKYYLPEIIRHALKFKYIKGARPKVLSLLFEK